MRFKFCGNLDCPDWLITEIIFLTKISAVKLRIICNQMVNFIINKGKNLSSIIKILEDMNMSYSDSLIVISVIEFILSSSAKFDVDDLILNQELLQLGLPQENCDSISKVFKLKKTNLREFLYKNIFNFNLIEDIQFKTSYIISNCNSNFHYENLKENENLIDNNFNIHSLQKKLISLNFSLENEVPSTSISLTIDKEGLGKLIQDLERCSEIIKKYKEQ